MSEEQAERIRNTREREILRVQKGVAALPDSFDAHIVGVTFVPGYPENIYELERLNFEAETTGECLTAIIRRNPYNEYDTNACEVHAPALGSNGMIGHIPKPLAARLAPCLDNGEIWQGEISYVRIHPDNPSNPGLTIKLNRVQ